MKNATCVYTATPDNDVDKLVAAVTGRCVLHSIWVGLQNQTPTGAAELPPQLKLYNDSGESDLRCQLSGPPQPLVAGEYGSKYGSQWFFDIPSDGILFEDGIWIGYEPISGNIDADVTINGVALFIVGGEAA